MFYARMRHGAHFKSAAHCLQLLFIVESKSISLQTEIKSVHLMIRLFNDKSFNDRLLIITVPDIPSIHSLATAQPLPLDATEQPLAEMEADRDTKANPGSSRRKRTLGFAEEPDAVKKRRTTVVAEPPAASMREVMRLHVNSAVLASHGEFFCKLLHFAQFCFLCSRSHTTHADKMFLSPMIEGQCKEFTLAVRDEDEAKHLEMLMRVMYGADPPTTVYDAISLLRLCDQYQLGELSGRIGKNVANQLDFAAACVIIDMYADVPVTQWNADVQNKAVEAVMAHFTQRCAPPLYHPVRYTILDSISLYIALMQGDFLWPFQKESANLSYHVMEVLASRWFEQIIVAADLLFVQTATDCRFRRKTRRWLW